MPFPSKLLHAGRRASPPAVALLLALLATDAPAQQQQVAFSVDWKGPLVGLPDTAFGFPITEGDVLVPGLGVPAPGPLPFPALSISGGFGPPGPGLALFNHPPCVGHPGGTPCGVEVDALSYGFDHPYLVGGQPSWRLAFSTDSWARGNPGLPAPPTVFTEAPPGDVSGDVLVDLGLVPGPLPPFAAPLPGSVAILDGDGLPAGSGFVYGGVGLFEPNPPVPLLPTPGDNLDALEIEAAFPPPWPPQGVFYSLDAPFPDPLNGFPGSATAAIHGFVGGDVLWTQAPGLGPVVFAPAPLLGLDLLGGPDTDDLDALALWENGSLVFEPSQSPNDWLGGGTDMLLFSVRRGSIVIGAPDSIFGLPIEEGDVLTTPLSPAAGGKSPFPGIYFAAENLGLATVRSGLANIGDDLDALDTLSLPLHDCNTNGIEDAVEIAMGLAPDGNGNGVPDGCEQFAPGCTCPPPLSPCGNPDPGAGCFNSTGAGALLAALNTTSVSMDELLLATTSLPPNVNGILFMGTATIAPVFLGDGLRCVGGTTWRYPFQSSGPAGTMLYGPGLAAWTVANNPPAGHLVPGTTWVFQTWYRDPAGPCGKTFNVSSSVGMTFTP